MSGHSVVTNPFLVSMTGALSVWLGVFFKAIEPVLWIVPTQCADRLREMNSRVQVGKMKVGDWLVCARVVGPGDQTCGL